MGCHGFSCLLESFEVIGIDNLMLWVCIRVHQRLAIHIELYMTARTRHTLVISLVATLHLECLVLVASTG